VVQCNLRGGTVMQGVNFVTEIELVDGSVFSIALRIVSRLKGIDIEERNTNSE